MSQTLWGYKPDHPVSEEARRAYGGVLPLLMDYLVEEFVPQHVEERRRDVALEDLWERVNELLKEARIQVGMGRPDSTHTWEIAKRAFSWARRSSDLRSRRRRLPDPLPLLDEHAMILHQIDNALPRRSKSALMPEAEFECMPET